MVLVNAMYFKGLWQTPFRREATKPGEFLLSNGVIKMAKFMQTRRYYKTGVDSYTGSKVIVVPFEVLNFIISVAALQRKPFNYFNQYYSIALVVFKCSCL